MANKQQKLISPPKNRAQYAKLIKKGQAYVKRQEHLEALRYLTAAWKFDDSDPNLLILVADCLFNNGNKSAAMQLMVHALERRPNDPTIASILGNAALKMNFFELAQKFHQVYIELRPDDVLGYNNYATALREDGKLDEAVEYLQDIIPLFADKDIIWNTLASIITFRDGPGNGIVFYEECLKLNPENTQALNNISAAYASVGELEKAEQSANKAIEINPKMIDPKLFLSNLMLNSKRLSEGWEKYQLRPTVETFQATIKHNKIPYWNGEDLTGKSIIIYGEQGIGDEVLFTWLYNKLLDVAGKVAFSCEGRLVEMFKSSFPDAQVEETKYLINYQLDYTVYTTPELDLKNFDYQCLAGDLPKEFWKSYDDIEPNSDPVLHLNEDVVRKWKDRIDELPHDISVGIAWRSGNRLAKRSRNYALLLEWGKLMKDKDVNFINIQYGDCNEELEELEREMGIKIHNFEDLDLKDDFVSTTAMIKSLDLAMGPSSSPIHQAALVGTKAWFFTYGRPWWAFGDEIPVWRQNARVLAKNENVQWADFMEEKAKDFDEWVEQQKK